MQRISLLLTAGALAFGQLVADHATAADLFLVHGINGEDVGADEEFPVDILIDLPPDGFGPEDVCVSGVEFTDTLGPETLEAGLYGVEIREAVTVPNGVTECEGALVVADVLSISEIETAIVLAHLDAQGAPVVSKFTVNASELDDSEVRLSAIHAAVLGAVDIEILERDTGDETIFTNVLNGQQTFPLEGEDGRYRIQILDAGTGERLDRRNITLDEGEVGVGVLVGSAANETLEILRLLIDTTEPTLPMVADDSAG
jgi:hypothetical protein